MKNFDLEAQEKRLGLNFGKHQVSKRLYSGGDFSPYNLIWESTLPSHLRDQYARLAEKRKKIADEQKRKATMVEVVKKPDTSNQMTEQPIKKN